MRNLTSRTIEPGDVIAISGRPFRVRSIDHPKNVPGVEVPHVWPDQARTDAVVMELDVLTDPDEGRRARAVLPGVRPPWQVDWYWIVSKAADEGHWMQCHRCGEPWPCDELETIRRGQRLADSLERSIEAETVYPVACPAGCPKRFRTERGAQQHLARSRLHGRT
jgi:hypothetical protein